MEMGHNLFEIYFILLSKQIQSWQVKISFGALRTHNGPLISLKADDDLRMSLQFPTITIFIGTLEVRHPHSKAEDGRLVSVRPQGNFSARIEPWTSGRKGKICLMLRV